jgi:L-fuconolactonase
LNIDDTVNEDMRFVDAHTHVWGHNTNELPWQVEMLPPEWKGPYTHADLLTDMDRLGIDESVVVTLPLYGRGPRANEYTMRAIEAHPDRLWGVGVVDWYPDDRDLAASVRRITGHERILGVRMHAPFEYAAAPTELNRDADWILDEALDPAWEELERQDACMFIFPKAEQLTMVDTLARRHPGVDIVVDHMAWPDETTAPDEPPWTDFEALADHANTYVKVSSVPRSTETEWPYPDGHEYLRRLLDWFGSERLMLGSDYPWMDSWGSYGDCLSWVEELDFLSARDFSHLSHRTFDRLHLD